MCSCHGRDLTYWQNGTSTSYPKEWWDKGGLNRQSLLLPLAADSTAWHCARAEEAAGRGVPHLILFQAIDRLALLVGAVPGTYQVPGTEAQTGGVWDSIIYSICPGCGHRVWIAAYENYY